VRNSRSGADLDDLNLLFVPRLIRTETKVLFQRVLEELLAARIQLGSIFGVCSLLTEESGAVSNSLVART
jgi:hypothetical protein